MERKGLGRGLSSLIGTPLSEDPRVLQVPLSEIRPNPHQPRQEWNDDALQELADSIRANGILQPIIIRGRSGGYELVAGERRLRAARLAGLTHAPAILRETDEEGLLRLALIENIQREDISPLDAAQAYHHLVTDFKMTQEEVARAVGKSRPAVANALRLLRLPDSIRESLRSRTITEGHARALLSVEDPREQLRLCRLAEGGASVRDIEDEARKALHPAPAAESGAEVRSVVRRPHPNLPHLNALSDELRRALGLKVEIRGDDNAGQLVIDYYSQDDLQDLADRLLRDNAPRSSD